MLSPAASRSIAALRAIGLSVAVLIPCFWHDRIAAGDLGSHTYNAYLASLIRQGQAPGLYIAPQWTNALFDLLLSSAAIALDFLAAERLVVSAAVLVFFWGAFAFIAVQGQRRPWLLTPAIAAIAYGYFIAPNLMDSAVEVSSSH